MRQIFYATTVTALIAAAVACSDNNTKGDAGPGAQVCPTTIAAATKTPATPRERRRGRLVPRRSLHLRRRLPVRQLHAASDLHVRRRDEQVRVRRRRERQPRRGRHDGPDPGLQLDREPKPDRHLPGDRRRGEGRARQPGRVQERRPGLHLRDRVHLAAAAPRRLPVQGQHDGQPRLSGWECDVHACP